MKNYSTGKKKICETFKFMQIQYNNKAIYSAVPLNNSGVFFYLSVVFIQFSKAELTKTY